MNVINELLELFKDVPLNASSINLTERNLQDFDLIGSSLAQFKQLEELNLSSNAITTIFRNTQPYFQLQSMRQLNICENPIEDILKSIKEIHQVFPNLVDLKINLYEEADVDFIINHMAQLQNLNGLPVEREELDNFVEEQNEEESPTKEENSFANYFDKSHDNQQEADQEEGKREAQVQSLAQQIQSRMPGGERLVKAEGRHRFIEKKRNNEQSSSLNSQPSNRGVVELDLNPQELEQIALLYDQIRDLFKSQNLTYDKKLATEFDNHLKTVMINLSNALKNPELSVREKNAEVLKSKFFLYDVCFEKSIQYLSVSEGSSSCVDVFEQIRQGTCASFVFLSEQIQMRLEEVKQEAQTRKKEEVKQEVQMMKKKEEAKSQKKVDQQVNVENKSLKEYVKHLEDKLEGSEKEKFEIIEGNEKEKEELLAQIKNLEEENRKCIQTLIKHSKLNQESQNVSLKQLGQGSKEQPIAYEKELDLSDIPQPREYSNHTISPVLSPMTNPPAALDQKNPSQNDKAPLALNKSHLNRLFPLPQKPDPKKGKLKYLNQSVLTSASQARHLSLKQMKDLINDIYTNKKKHDEKNELNKLPRETMEQFMYTYLNQRYGLKQLIVEWAGAIINGIKQYQKVDNDVCLFGKVLRNDVEEDFRFVATHVKETVHGLLKILIKERYPLKGENEVGRMMEDIVGDRVVLEGIYWIKIVERMYEDQDIVILQQKIKDSARARYQQELEQEIMQKSGKNNKQARMSREEQIQLQNKLNDSAGSQGRLYFGDFLKNMLDFQLREHEKFLRPFILVFRCIDQDGNGILDEQQFVDLIQKIGFGSNNEDIHYFLQVLDPFNTQNITFSEIVSLFSGHQVNEEERHQDGSVSEKRVSLLEKFSRFCP